MRDERDAKGIENFEQHECSSCCCCLLFLNLCASAGCFCCDEANTSGCLLQQPVLACVSARFDDFCFMLAAAPNPLIVARQVDYKVLSRTERRFGLCSLSGALFRAPPSRLQQKPRLITRQVRASIRVSEFQHCIGRSVCSGNSPDSSAEGRLNNSGAAASTQV